MIPMVETDSLDDEELEATAHVWRRRALHGDKSAAVVANELEKALRRRRGVTTQISDLDTRPLLLRQTQRPWWRFW